MIRIMEKERAALFSLGSSIISLYAAVYHLNLARLNPELPAIQGKASEHIDKNLTEAMDALRTYMKAMGINVEEPHG